MDKPIIEIKNISKKYRYGQRLPYYSLRDSVTEFLKNPFSKMNLPFPGKINLKNEFWALNNITFNVNKGEIIGIIGRNGAGKSTLLKILSRITPPTRGQITLRGRVASLLEVGTGFNPELTGRENVLLNGAILGMTRKEINEKFDAIVAFAEIEKFIDTPVKFYSSGMYMRLAFAVASHLEPEILIIDEVLSVGDSHFQKKSLGKMEEIANEGRTILFVSHSMMTISKLCKKVILLDEGKIQYQGSVDNVIGKYLNENDKTVSERKWDKNSAPGDNYVRLTSVKILNQNLKVQNIFDYNSPVLIELDYKVLRNNSIITLGIQIFNSEEIAVFSSNNTKWKEKEEKRKKGIYKTIVEIPASFLNFDKYFLRVVMSTFYPKTKHLSEKDVVSFRIRHIQPKTLIANLEDSSSLIGVVRPQLEWKTEMIKSIK